MDSQSLTSQPLDEACVDTIGQLLSGLDGNHAWMTPVYNSVGRLVDFRVAAASAAARDVAGRPGPSMVGLPMRRTYPQTIRGEIWRAYRDAYLTGEPQSAGPAAYTGPVTAVPASLRIAVSVHRAGPGILVTWTQRTGEGDLAERIAQTERLGNLGWSEHDLITGETVWSDQLYRIYGRDPADGPLSTAETLEVTVPEDRPIRHQIAELLAQGSPADVTYRIRTSRGVRHIRVVADVVRDVSGRPLRTYGIVQDVSDDETSRHKIAEVQQELRARQRDLAAEARLASHLQEIILPIPATPVDLPGLRVAVRYLPAEQASRIGGDWYHAGASGDGSVVLAIGDVAGHGLPAAAAMARMRHAFAALSHTATTDPAALLTHLNRLMFAGDEPQTIASTVVARYDPARRRLQWAQAGHLPPLLSRDGVTTELPRPSGPLLGAIPDARFGVADLTLEDGDLLVFYTDGLVERRDRGVDEGLRDVIALLDRITAEHARQPLADLVGRLDRANPSDDTCVVAIRAIPLVANYGIARGGDGAAVASAEGGPGSAADPHPGR